MRNRLLAQYAGKVINVVNVECFGAGTVSNDLRQTCKVSIRNLERLSEILDDAFMIATCQSLIEAFKEAEQLGHLDGLVRQYGLPLRYFLKRFRARDLTESGFLPKRRVMV